MSSPSKRVILPFLDDDAEGGVDSVLECIALLGLT